jgi:hypothetical protein
MRQRRRTRVTGVGQNEIDQEVGLIFWLQAKRVLRERRQKEAKARAKRRERENRE